MNALSPSLSPQGPRAEAGSLRLSPVVVVTLVSYKYVRTVCASRSVNNFDPFCLCFGGPEAGPEGTACIS